ncbi:hypothetical protein [Romboutsia lituseburensis]|uniref:hypothetical protein n=1 Tax=Romboutsia lituseburensis TaxID=1537 RepID=UPI00215AA26C|nr:hypothetical protein [Romboutsia lituseburensis]MCR8744332.1 hypothetical protein [Romboutsia lituseburensis]
MTDWLANLRNSQGSSIYDVVGGTSYLAEEVLNAKINMVNQLSNKGVTVGMNNSMSNIVNSIANIPMGKKVAMGGPVAAGDPILKFRSLDDRSEARYGRKTITFDLNQLGFTPGYIYFYTTSFSYSGYVTFVDFTHRLYAADMFINTQVFTDQVGAGGSLGRVIREGNLIRVEGCITEHNETFNWIAHEL